MMQQLLAILIIVYFLVKLIWQKKRHSISRSEFIFWLLFWLFSALVILYLPVLDRIVQNLGFSASGIEVMLYLSVAVLFYFLFRIRLRMEKLDRNITKIVRALAIEERAGPKIKNVSDKPLTTKI